MPLKVQDDDDFEDFVEDCEDDWEVLVCYVGLCDVEEPADKEVLVSVEAQVVEEVEVQVLEAGSLVGEEGEGVASGADVDASGGGDGEGASAAASGGGGGGGGGA